MIDFSRSRFLFIDVFHLEQLSTLENKVKNFYQLDPIYF